MNFDPTKTTSQSDVLDVARAQVMQVALGHAPSIQAGDPLPPFFHQLYFWQPQPPSALGRDGHPTVGGIVPDTGLPRRMWAGGSLMFDHPILGRKIIYPIMYQYMGGRSAVGGWGVGTEVAG